MAMPVIIDTADIKTFTSEAASFIAKSMRDAIASRGRAFLGLSGGSTPGPVYRALGQTPDIDWPKVWIFLVDDRYIRKDSPHSNQFLIRSTLLQQAPVPESQILFPNTALSIEECLAEYDAVLRSAFDHYVPDLLILGMGPDGHIASLFPPLREDGLSNHIVIHTTTDQFDIPDRITLTFPALQRSREALFLLKGTAKKKLWEQMVGSPDDALRWPAKAVIDAMPTTVIVVP